jgi:sec-independent protein translocase protein TatC
MPNQPPDKPRYLSEHLTELRRGLIRSMVLLTTGVGLAYWKSDWLFSLLLRPFESALARLPEMNGQAHMLQTLTPFEVFMVNMKLAVVAGIIAVSPLLLREIWVFASPALKPNERAGVSMVFLLGLFFFCGGLAFGYFAVIPMTLQFLIHYNLSFHFNPQWTLQGYFGFVVNFLLLFGCFFELPLVLAALVHIGVATPAFLSQKRKHAIIAIFILAAFIAPSPDPVTQCIVALPLVLLYEAGIWLSYLAMKKEP